MNLIKKEWIFSEQSFNSKNELFTYIAKRMQANNATTEDIETIIKELNWRENQGSTYMGNGIAIPHAKLAKLRDPIVILAKLKTPLEWNKNNYAKNVFFIIVPKNTAEDHLLLLSKLASILMDKNIVDSLSECSDEKIVNLFTVADNSNTTEQKTVTNNQSQAYDIVAITACVTGLAHTFLAKESLENAAEKLNKTIKVETQSAGKINNRLSESEIKQAKKIILAVDVPVVDDSRLNGFMVNKISTKKAINDAEQVIQNNDIKKSEKYQAMSDGDTADFSGGDTFSLRNFKNPYKSLMGGVSKMLPFVVAGGILIGLSFLFDSGNTGTTLGTGNIVSKFINMLGGVGLSKLMVVVLAGYISYSVAGAAGLMPGMVGGWICNGGGSAEETAYWGHSGFLGGIVAGYAAAFIVWMLLKAFQRFPKSIKGIKDILIIPLASMVLIGLLMFVLNIPLGYIMYGVELGLQELSKYNLGILLGLILGFCMAIDMGGPINKAASYVAIALLDKDNTLMAACMAGGMVPPLGIALASNVFRNLFPKEQKQAANANWFLGLSYITEGAIPFAAANPKVIIPSICVGSAIAGAITMGLQIGLPAPHGGIFVFAILKSKLFATTGLQIGFGILFYIIALFIGMVAEALMIKILSKKFPISQALVKPVPKTSVFKEIKNKKVKGENKKW